MTGARTFAAELNAGLGKDCRLRIAEVDRPGDTWAAYPTRDLPLIGRVGLLLTASQIAGNTPR